MSKVKKWLAELPAKARVLLGAWPTWAALGTGLLTVAAEEVVPELPGGWGVKGAAYVATGVAVIATISRVVARVTPILFPQNIGLLAPPPAQSPTRSLAHGGIVSSHVRVSDGVAGPLPPVPPEAYPPGSERLPHRRPG